MQNEYGQEKMAREQFDVRLKEQVSEALGTGYQVEQKQIRKNNGVRKDALCVQEENKECTPSFYLEEMYDSYCLGQPVAALAEHIAEVVRQEDTLGFAKVEQLLKQEWFEKRLFLRLIHFEKNRDWLEHTVYVRIHDLAAVFCVLTEQKREGLKSFCLPKSIWEQAGLGTAEEYYDTILKNTERLFPLELMRIEEQLLQCMEQETGEASGQLRQECEKLLQEETDTAFYVLTNTARINGAAVILYETVSERLRECFGEHFQNGLWVIPSSIHEVLLLPATKEGEEALNRMVQEVNKTQVVPEEVLSDHVYRYAADGGFWNRQCSEE